MHQAVASDATPSLPPPQQQAAFCALRVLGRRPRHTVSFMLGRPAASRFHHSQSLKPRVPFLTRANGNLDIISVKELPDGSFHFSFGVSSEQNKFSFSTGERKLTSQRRPPSQFLKKSPIPVASKRQRSQEKTSIKGDSVSVPESALLPSRPKSCFVKRSPIPKLTCPKNPDQSFHEQPGDAQCGKNDAFVQGPTGPLKGDKPKILSSRFVKRSPIPAATIGIHRSLHNIEQKAGDYSVSILGNGVGVNNSRPKSKFVRKSPIIKVNRHADSTVETLEATTAFLSSRTKSKPSITKLQNASEDVAQRPKSKFVRKSPIAKVNRHVADSTVETSEATTAFLHSRTKSKSSITKLGNASEEVVQEKSNTDVSISKAYEVKHSQNFDSPDHMDLDNCKVAELRSLAKTKGLKGYSKLRKAELLALLKGLKS